MTVLPTPDTGVHGGEGSKLGPDIDTGIDQSSVSGGSDTDVPQRRIRKKNQEEEQAAGEVEGGSQRPTLGVAGTADDDGESIEATLDELRTHPDETIRQIVERLSQSLGDIDYGDR